MNYIAFLLVTIFGIWVHSNSHLPTVVDTKVSDITIILNIEPRRHI